MSPFFKIREKKAQPYSAPKNRYSSTPFPQQHQAKPGIEAELDPAPAWRGRYYRPADKLRGMRALITGGDSGIGRSVAYFYAREGADVVITCLPEERRDAAEVRGAIEELGRRCVVIEGDLAELDACNRAVDTTLEELGGIDILVHNAGWQNRRRVEDLPEEDMDRTMKVNIYAYLRLCRRAVPHMKPGSSIIASGSIVGMAGSDEMTDYAATKGAIHAITKSLAKELLDKGIRANVVAPGPVWTPLNAADTGMSAEEVAGFGSEAGASPMERPAQPEELAPSYVFLASNADSGYITGIVLPVTGGKR
ncbi:MAG: SDR family oxidoreductase [Phycisphaerales bacterium]|nr:SDR family oxidoreductase [Planctomycetota bacterium]MCH8509915.1 SDR family oxidoreductase [Phycisphaerales bacterium]